MNAERQRGIPIQPDPACPIADRAISMCEDAKDQAEDIEKEDDLDTIHEWARDVESSVEDAQGYIEELRSRCEDLRAWSQAWKDEALSLQEKVDDLEAEA